MDNYTKYDERVIARIQKIFDFLVKQANKAQKTPEIVIVARNTVSNEMGLKFSDGSTESLSEFLTKTVPSKIAHYGEWEFGRVGGEPVLRPTPLFTTTFKKQHKAISDMWNALDDDGTPNTYADCCYLQVEKMFNVDLDTWNINKPWDSGNTEQ